MDSRELRVAVGLRRWARYALRKHYASASADAYAAWERLHSAAEKAHEKLDPGDRTEYQLWTLGEKRKAT